MNANLAAQSAVQLERYKRDMRYYDTSERVRQMMGSQREARSKPTAPQPFTPLTELPGNPRPVLETREQFVANLTDADMVREGEDMVPVARSDEDYAVYSVAPEPWVAKLERYTNVLDDARRRFLPYPCLPI